MVLKLLFLLEYVKPLFQAVSMVLLVVSGAFAARAPRSLGLMLLSIACFLSAFTVGVYFTGSLQTDWKVALFPVAIRRVIFLLADLVYPIEVFLWPAAVILISRARRSSGTPTI